METRLVSGATLGGDIWGPCWVEADFWGESSMRKRRRRDRRGRSKRLQTRTAGRCCHEGRARPSMVRWTQPLRDAQARSRKRVPCGMRDLRPSTEGQCGVQSLQGFWRARRPELTGRRWEKSRRRLFSFGAKNARVLNSW